MKNTRSFTTISISHDTHEYIVKQGKFMESIDTVLRRLLKLQKPKEVKHAPKAIKKSISNSRTKQDDSSDQLERDIVTSDVSA